MNKRFLQRRSRAGFTVIELMMVVLVIAILSGLVLAIAGVAGRKADRTKAVAEMEKLNNLLEDFRDEKGVYPDDLTSLGGTRPKSDPWGRDYKYSVVTPKKLTFKLWSSGPDGADGTSDDVGVSKGQM